MATKRRVIEFKKQEPMKTHPQKTFYDTYGNNVTIAMIAFLTGVLLILISMAQYCKW